MGGGVQQRGKMAFSSPPAMATAVATFQKVASGAVAALLVGASGVGTEVAGGGGGPHAAAGLDSASDAGGVDASCEMQPSARSSWLSATPKSSSSSSSSSSESDLSPEPDGGLRMPPVYDPSSPESFYAQCPRTATGRSASDEKKLAKGIFRKCTAPAKRFLNSVCALCGAVSKFDKFNLYLKMTYCKTDQLSAVKREISNVKVDFNELREAMFEYVSGGRGELLPLWCAKRVVSLCEDALPEKCGIPWPAAHRIADRLSPQFEVEQTPMVVPANVADDALTQAFLWQYRLLQDHSAESGGSAGKNATSASSDVATIPSTNCASEKVTPEQFTLPPLFTEKAFDKIGMQAVLGESRVRAIQTGGFDKDPPAFRFFSVHDDPPVHGFPIAEVYYRQGGTDGAVSGTEVRFVFGKSPSSAVTAQTLGKAELKGVVYAKLSSSYTWY